MLDNATIKRIEDFVNQRPRSIQEIAIYIGKNWRTADRYVDEIAHEYGTLATRVFRGGTRGALKVVYWASVEQAHRSTFQERLEKEITLGRNKEDFSPFDLFQHIPDKQKQAYIEYDGASEHSRVARLNQFLNTAKKQVLIFSGNLSFVNDRDKKLDVLKTLDALVRKGVGIKALCRVDVAGKDNIQKLYSIAFKHGKDLVEIRHHHQPLRAFITDNKIARLKEIKEPTGRTGELNKRAHLFYEIHDKEWVEWLSRVFWNMFSSSIDARRRLEEIAKIRLKG